MFKKVSVGQLIRRKRVLDVINLSNGWQLIKTENAKSPRDFKVKVINPQHPQGLTIKHAHFALDFYGKFCQDKGKAFKVLRAISRAWHGKNINKLIKTYGPKVRGLVGYDFEYLLYAFNWVLEQEDINFKGRSPAKQKELDGKLGKLGIKTPRGRKGSQLAIALLCDIASGVHPVEAFYGAGLRI